jgi:hypothetical protein
VRVVERKQIANVVIPAVAVAALIALAALVLVAGGSNVTPAGKPKVEDTVPVATLPGAAGMSDRLPPLDSSEWQDIGDGLKIWDVREGEGEPVSPGARVTAHYTGWLTDGTVFDSSVRRGEPTPFPLTGVIPGWQRGIPGMKPGGIRRLYIPSDLAYGPRGQPPTIPPAADLVFEVKLISSP